jgi:hypothetical protein
MCTYTNNISINVFKGFNYPSVSYTNYIMAYCTIGQT